MKNISLTFLILISFGIKGISQTKIDILKLYHGTSVIAFLKDDIGWIAADSKVVEEVNGVESSFQTVRKIKRTKDIFYAFTIIPIMHFNDDLIYDAFALMHSTIKEEKDFNKSFETFDSIITAKLNFAIKVLKNNNQIAILDKYTKTSILGFLMVQYQNGKPNYQIRSYKFQKEAENYNTIQDPPLIMQGVYPVLFLGNYEAAIEYIKTHPKYFVGFENIREKLICLVAEEVSANPDYVGFPIDTVEITQRGHKWRYGNVKCSLE